MRILLCFTFILLGACQSEKAAQPPATQQPEQKTTVDAVKTVPQPAVAVSTTDPHSYANADEVVITHMHLVLDVDFQKQQLQGKNCISYQKLKDTVSQLILDTRDLTIERVVAGDTELNWYLAPRDENLGQALVIDLPATQEMIDVYYASAPSASGLQWLKPQQTSGKNHPFLFTQSQAIHARSWIPSQDTPRVRHTYSAEITVDPAVRAVMSADNNPQRSADGVYRFNMPQAIPSYLIALAVGDLDYKSVSETVAVYAEKAYLEAAAYEFAETENMITAAEAMYGEYRWGVYDLLILPPSFPFGGMENPRLSFITPTILAGDRSLDSLIAHELAHSWSGNLVTNSSWRDLWLNEGFTTYFESRITEAVHGRDRMQMEAVLNYEGLQEELKTLEPKYQKLAIDLSGKDPDDAFSGVPYDKGRFFLDWLEHSVGRDVFDAFLNSYFDHFAFKSINTEDFLSYLDTHLIQKNSDKVSMKDVKQWIFEPGIPEFAVVPTTDKFSNLDELVAQLSSNAISLQDLPVDAWTTQEWLYFLKHLPSPTSTEEMQKLDAAFNLTQVSNSEIAHVWLLMSIASDYQPAFSRMEDYLVEIGRRKLITPLYEALVKTPAHKQWAEQVYTKARPGYHNLAQGTVDKIFKSAE
ncbi:M1 family metallopeptidase [Marinicella sp. W31]|uniref:M1 family metallopeptidase n=1 Tax=Marinicella sp. W31 TaxID=3023713 RepID=UPI003758036C